MRSTEQGLETNSNPNRVSSRKEKQTNARTRRTYLAVWIALGLASAGLAQERPLDPAKADYHVAPGGKDTNPGTAAAPFATVQAARDAVRKKIAAGLRGDVLVLIRGGTYRITEAIDFGPEDSGTEKHAITYAAAPGEKVVISGGRPITGWKKGEGEIWTAEIPEAKADKPVRRSLGEGGWYFRQLFVNGYRAIRARTPNAIVSTGPRTGGETPWNTVMISEAPGKKDYRENWWRIKKSTLNQESMRKGADPKAPLVTKEPIVITVSGPVVEYRNVSDVELVTKHGNGAARKRLEAVNAETQEITMAPPHIWNPLCYGTEWWLGPPIQGAACRLENAVEMLDSPGEWYLDRSTGVLSYWPRPGEDLGQVEIIAPLAIKSLLVVMGERERPVRNLHFHGLHLEHNDWPLPPQGYQAMFCCNFPAYREAGKTPGHRFIDAAVEFGHARSCSFRDGGIAHVWGVGLCLREGTGDLAIEGNEIHDTGAGGIGAGRCNVAAGVMDAMTDPPQADEYRGYRIRNNWVHHCGRHDLSAVGITLFQMRDSDISHNLVHDTAYSAVQIGASMGRRDDDYVGGNVIQRNHLFRGMLTTGFGGNIYLCQRHGKDGLLFRDNFLHDAGGNWCAIALDQSPIAMRVVRNAVLAGPTGRAFGNVANQGGLGEVWKNNLWQDNVFWGDVPMPATDLFPEEFLEVMRAYTGLEPRYRKSLQGIEGEPCELHELGTVPDNASWHAYQYDLKGSGRGVVLLIRHIDYQVLVENEDPAVWWKAGCESVAMRLKGLDPWATYRVKAYNGSVVRRKGPGSNVISRTWPYVPKVAIVEPDQIGIKVAASGKELGEKGLTVKVGASPCMIWIAYRRAE